jgi:hypothetical protein
MKRTGKRGLCGLLGFGEYSARGKSALAFKMEFESARISMGDSEPGLL